MGGREMDVRSENIGSRQVGFVHCENLRDLHDTGFDCLNIVTRPWRVAINEVLIRPTEQEG